MRDLIIRNPSLEPIDKVVLIDILLYGGVTGAAFPSETTLARNQNRSERWIQEVIKRLKAKSWIIKTKRRGFSQSNLYTLNPELYFGNDNTNQMPTSDQSGTTLPVQTSSGLPTNNSQEVNQISSEIQLQVKRALGNNYNATAVRRIRKLCQAYTETWVSDAINVIVKRNPPFIKVGLIEKVLQDWQKDGKPEPKPLFTPCNKDGCQDGFIRNLNNQSYLICECKTKHDVLKKRWVEKWGSYDS